VKKVIATDGLGGFWNDDNEAIKRGATLDGFTYKGDPITPGFIAIRQPSKAVCLIFVLDTGELATGDCTWVQYGGERAGREKLASPEDVIPLIHQEIEPWLIDRELEDFRSLMVELEEELNPPRAVKYGVSQAILDAIAKDRRVTMAEVLAEEYGTTIENRPLVFFTQCGDEYYTTVDKMILRRVPVLPHALINSIPRFQQLLAYVTWTTQRVRDLVPDVNYHPILHFDLYGTLGLALDNDIEQMVGYLRQLEDVATPFELYVEDPVHLPTQAEHIEIMSKLRTQIKHEDLAVKLVADEWAPTLQDKIAFIKAGAADIYQIKTPDLGSIAKSVEAVLYCKAKGVGTYLGGSSAETARSAQVTVHIGLATQPDQVLAKPGMGVDEGISLMYNEMRRALAIIFQ
jgi:methylaspartate ammonia-lyase